MDGKTGELTQWENGRSNIVFTEATLLKTAEAAASVASNVATALYNGKKHYAIKLTTAKQS